MAISHLRPFTAADFTHLTTTSLRAFMLRVLTATGYVETKPKQDMQPGHIILTSPTGERVLLDASVRRGWPTTLYHMRALQGAMDLHSATRALFLATGHITAEASDFAEFRPISMIELDGLASMADSVLPGASRAELESMVR